MATKITLFQDFANGQGAGASSYFNYAQDHDTNYTLLQTLTDSLVDEINSFQGSISLFGQDLMIMDDPNRPGNLIALTPERDGLVGVGSYSNTIAGAVLTINPGIASISGVRVSQATVVIKTNIETSQDVFLALDGAGVPFLEASAGNRILDIYSFTADGSANLSAPVRLVNIMNDGDEYELSRKRLGTTPVNDYRITVEFVDGGGGNDTITRATGDFVADGFVAGQTLSVNGTLSNDGDYTISVVNTLSLEVPTASLVAETGQDGVRLNAGLFGFEDFDQVHERFEQLETILSGEDGAGGERILFPDGLVSDPGIRFKSTPAGMYFGGGALRFAISGGDRFRVTGDQCLFRNGTNIKPSITFDGNSKIGMWRQNSNGLGFSVAPGGGAGTEAARLDPDGHFHLFLNSRVKGFATTLSQSFADAAATNVRFDDADQIENGAWHTPGDDTAGEEFTVPADAEGIYSIVLNFEWAGPATNGRDMLQEITVDNTRVASSERTTATSEVYGDTLVVYTDLVAAQVVRARLTQTDAVGALALVLDAATLSIIKVA